MPPPELVEIPLPKGCLLLLTVAEYTRGLARGKAQRRRLALDARLEERRREADALAVPNEKPRVWYGWARSFEAERRAREGTG
jgi:hypothetical protein